MLHNRYLEGGGEDQSTAAETNLLLARGHEVDTLLEDNSRVAQLGRLRTAAKAVWSREAYNLVLNTLTRSEYDVVSVQNFFPLLSPAVYYAARRSNVSVVQTLRNYRLICPNGSLYRDGHVCEDCIGHSVPASSVLHACYRGSVSGTAVVASMLSLHRLARSWTRMVDQYVVLSNFMREKCIEGGLPADRITVKPNFVWPDPGCGSGRGGFALFAGRLSEEKGVLTLLEAWKHVRGGLSLRIVGEGPLNNVVAQAARDNASITWLGRRPWPEVLETMGQASVVVIPSRCHEGFGRVVIEAYSKGTPVLGSEMGSLAEIISHGRTGMLFRAGDPSALTGAINWIIEHPRSSQRMRAEARREYEAKYTGERNGLLLEKVFAKALGVARRRRCS
jgi:glycosyltransferase involved in cell wall biosynthesis